MVLYNNLNTKIDAHKGHNPNNKNHKEKSEMRPETNK